MLCRKYLVLSCSSTYFEEGSICMIHKECSCSNFSSHPLPKQNFSAFICGVQFLKLAMKLSTTSSNFQDFLKLPMKLSTGGDFCPHCHVGFFCWEVWTYWSQMKTGTTRRRYAFVVEKSPHLVSQCHLERRCGFAVCRYTHLQHSGFL